MTEPEPILTCQTMDPVVGCLDVMGGIGDKQVKWRSWLRWLLRHSFPLRPVGNTHYNRDGSFLNLPYKAVMENYWGGDS